MTVVEDGEVLAVASQVVRKPRAGQSVGQRVGGEARRPLLAVRDDRGARGLHPLDRVLAGGLLLTLQLLA